MTRTSSWEVESDGQIDTSTTSSHETSDSSFSDGGMNTGGIVLTMLVIPIGYLSFITMLLGLSVGTFVAVGS